jgi:hypothetical protein
MSFIRAIFEARSFDARPVKTLSLKKLAEMRRGEGVMAVVVIAAGGGGSGA